MEIEIQWFEGCPHAEPTRARVREVVARLAPEAEVVDVVVRDPDHARAIHFRGSPSVLVDGRDIEGRTDPGGAMSCRLYEGGPPTEWLIEAAILRALSPRGWLFLCVANSARSQLAEGITRRLAPADVWVGSAGSEPSSVRPEAIEVLAEIGVDTTAHRSKGMGEIDAARVEVVVTLCAEEVCPAWLGAAPRVHWGLPDPAAFEGEGRMDAFRRTRDELSRRLRAVFG